MSEIEGLDELRQNLSDKVDQTKANIVAGVIDAQMIVRRRSAIYTPAKTGNLVNSLTTPSPIIEASRIVGTIGYTADYAPYVHENLEATNWTKPGSGPRFLARALNESHDAVLEAIRKRAQL